MVEVTCWRMSPQLSVKSLLRLGFRGYKPRTTVTYFAVPNATDRGLGNTQGSSNQSKNCRRMPVDVPYYNCVILASVERVISRCARFSPFLTRYITTRHIRLRIKGTSSGGDGEYSLSGMLLSPPTKCVFSPAYIPEKHSPRHQESPSRPHTRR